MSQDPGKTIDIDIDVDERDSGDAPTDSYFNPS